LIRQLDEKLCFTEGLAGCLNDRRHHSYVKQPLVDILRQRLYQIMAGYEDANSLRDDPVLKGVVGRLLSDESLSSRPTISRFEDMVMVKELYRLSVYLLEYYLSCKGCPLTRVIVDVDATDDPVHGHQQLSFFHGYYENYIYHSLLIYDGDTGELITALL
jgi:hypothetical protein